MQTESLPVPESRVQRCARRKADAVAERARRIAENDARLLADRAVIQESFAADPGAAECGGHPGSATPAAGAKQAIDSRRAAELAASKRHAETIEELDTDLAEALGDCYAQATSSAVDTLVCVYATACADIDAAIERLRVALRQAEADSGEQLDRQLAVAAGVVMLGQKPDSVRCLANPQSWLGNGFSNGGLTALGAGLAHALRGQDAAAKVAALGQFRTELAAVATGKWPALPEASALPRWEIRRACLLPQAELAALAELERAEQEAERASVQPQRTAWGEEMYLKFFVRGRCFQTANIRAGTSTIGVSYLADKVTALFDLAVPGDREALLQEIATIEARSKGLADLLRHKMTMMPGFDGMRRILRD